MSSLIRFLRAPTWERRKMIVSRTLVGYAPLGLLNWGAWYVFLGFHLIDFVATLIGAPITWSATSLAVMDGVTFAVVVLVGPNVLRTFCLHFVSSNMHYYGDVEPGNVIQQTQVLNPWWLWPLQAFCCNFGSTHGIHHFVVKEPLLYPPADRAGGAPGDARDGRALQRLRHLRPCQSLAGAGESYPRCQPAGREFPTLPFTGSPP